MTLSLFNEENAEPRTENLAPGCLLVPRGFALRDDAAHINRLGEVVAEARFAAWLSPGGSRNRGNDRLRLGWGWITDQTSYRYTSIDPESGQSGHRCPRVFWRSRTMRHRKLAFQTLFPMPASSIVTRPEPGLARSKRGNDDAE